MKEKAKSYNKGWYPEDPVLKREFIKYFRARNQIIIWLKLADWTNSQIGESMDLSKDTIKMICHKKLPGGRKNYP